MGTKLDPGDFDCYAKALPDEPFFCILARDPSFYELVTTWAMIRRRAVDCGERPAEDMRMVREAFAIAFAGQAWRKENNGKWRASSRQGSSGVDGGGPSRAVQLGPPAIP